MTKQKSKPFDNVSLQKKIIIVLGILLSVFGGIFATVVAIYNFNMFCR
jgi:hypothetical protein